MSSSISASAASASASASSSTAPAPVSGKKRKEPSEKEVAQQELLTQLFDAKNSTVLGKKKEQLGQPVQKKVKVEASSSSSSQSAAMEDVAPAKKAEFNPFVAAMDNSTAQKAAKLAATPLAKTQNGAATFSTTKAPNLDLFYHMARGYSAADINMSLPVCWKENPETTLKVLMHARDCHSSGKGERLIVYYALMWLRREKPRTYLANIMTFISHGYFKDLLNLIDMIDGKIVVQSVPQPKVKSGKKNKFTAKKAPIKPTPSSGSSIGASIKAAEDAKRKQRQGDASPFKKTSATDSILGGSGFELELYAEFLKADYVKLKQWNNAKAKYKKDKAAQEKMKEKASEMEYETNKAAASASSSSSTLTSAILPAKTAWFDVAEDVDEPGETEDGEWLDVGASVNKMTLEEKKKQEEKMEDVPTPIVPKVEVPTLVEPPQNCFISLAAKYAPSERHAYAHSAKRIARILFASEQAEKSAFTSAKHMQICMKKYRQMLSTLRAHLVITERLCCANRWDKINFNAVPSRCHQILKKSFMKHVPTKYTEYLNGLKKGVGKINVTGLQPHQLVEFYLKGGQLNETVEEAWKALVEKTREAGTFKGAVSVVDVSGSMSGLPMNVAIAMGLLVAEMCEGVYNNRVLTFHESPSWHTITGSTLRDRVACLAKAPWGGSTNLVATFDLILDIAKKYNVSQAHLPTTLFIFSDMQFDQAMGKSTSGWMSTNYNVIKTKFTKAKYTVPNIVFWNLNGAINKDTPIQCDTVGCALMSGFSSTLLNVFLKQTPPDEIVLAEGEEATEEQKAAANPMHPLRIMMDSIEEYHVVVEESER